MSISNEQRESVKIRESLSSVTYTAMPENFVDMLEVAANDLRTRNFDGRTVRISMAPVEPNRDTGESPLKLAVRFRDFRVPGGRKLGKEYRLNK